MTSRFRLLVGRGTPCAPILLALAAVTLLALTACSKKDQPGGSSASDSTNASSQPPPTYVTATAENALTENAAGEPDPFLTQQLRLFMQEKSRMPESFTELARARLDSVPRPPEGKKWVIDTATQQVKAVPAKP
jgi:hypothetical protein